MLSLARRLGTLSLLGPPSSRLSGRSPTLAPEVLCQFSTLFPFLLQLWPKILLKQHGKCLITIQIHSGESIAKVQICKFKHVKTVLIVDDDLGFAFCLGQALDRARYETWP